MGLINRACYIVLYICMVFSIVVAWYVYAQMYTITNVVFSFDPHIAQVKQKAITQLVHDILYRSKANTQVLSRQIKKQFSCIKFISISYEPCGLMLVTCKARKPYCFLNNKFVLTKDNIVISRNAFIPDNLTHLHTIFVDDQLLEQKSILQTCKQCVSALPSSIFTSYDVLWKSQIEAWLHDKKERFFIIFNLNNLPNEQLFAQCCKIKDELQPKIILKKNEWWIADIRFTNQVIVYKDSRGISYG